MDIINDFANIAKSILTSGANFVAGVVNVLLANPTLLYITLFLGLTSGKSIQLGKVFKAKG